MRWALVWGIPNTRLKAKSTALTTIANPSSASLEPMVSPTCQSQAASNTGGATQEEVLAIVLPIALITVVIVMLIVAAINIHSNLIPYQDMYNS